MVAVSDGELLNAAEIRENAKKIKNKTIEELVENYNKFKNIQNDPFKWGDEIELTLLKFDHEKKKCYLLLKAEEFFAHLEEENNIIFENDAELKKQIEFHNEFTNYIIETVPGSPFDHDINSISKVEESMKLRKLLIQKFLGKDEFVMSLTSFPMLGCKDFTWPIHNQDFHRQRDNYDSLFYSNKIVLPKALFFAATFNIIDRKREFPSVYVPIFRDEKTASPFIEDLSAYSDSLRKNEISKPDQIYMDHNGFGMGCCCIQMTFQASSLSQACYLYDQLTPIAPIIIALSASSPIWRSYLSDIDCRWNVLKQTMDDRTNEELGLEPLKNEKQILKKSRLDTTDVYLSKQASAYNDYDYDKDMDVYNELVNKHGMESSLANHFSSMFTREHIILFKQSISDTENCMNNCFELLNCSNWRLLRFKPPPMHSEESNKIGWRVEFRPTELQLTDFENAAFATYVILLTRAIEKLNLNFLIGITKVDENMQRAQKRNACVNEKFYFRQNMLDSAEKNAVLVELSINEIVNGNETFKGLNYFIREYLKTIENLNDQTKETIEKYLKLFELRANGSLMTPASFIRKFVKEHPKYENDSKINDEINYDLMWTLSQISNGKQDCPQLIPHF